MTTDEGTFKGESLDLGNDGQLKVRMPDDTVIPLFADEITHPG
jgi:hypothetical protein